MKLKGAQIIVETLIEQGASTVFGYPGGQVIDIYDALYLAQDRIHHIITAHEQGAAHAADGYARATGKVGVVIATSGPGATNLVTGIATAYLDSVPLVAITGNVPNSLIGRDSFQEVDITGVTMRYYLLQRPRSHLHRRRCNYRRCRCGSSGSGRKDRRTDRLHHDGHFRSTVLQSPLAGHGGYAWTLCLLHCTE